MTTSPQFEDAHTLLAEANLRPTRQRLGLCKLLFGQGNRHVKAETLHSEAVAAGLPVSLATVYNTLHQLHRAGLLRQINVDAASTYFDTNLAPHGHFFVKDEERLIDVSASELDIAALPTPPEGLEIDHVDVIVSLRTSRK